MAEIAKCFYTKMAEFSIFIPIKMAEFSILKLLPANHVKHFEICRYYLLEAISRAELFVFSHAVLLVYIAEKRIVI
jgi:hypothetical protein